MTQVELAQKSGVSRPNLSAIERGAREVTLKTLRALAMALDVRPGMLVDGCAPDGFAPDGCAPKDERVPLTRAALERVAEAAARGHEMSNAREAALAKSVRTAMSPGVAGSPAVHRRTGRAVKSRGRAADRAFFWLRATESPENVASLFQRTADKMRK
jgi:transcriptional regulator with XRE-family HTH domain